MFLIPLEAATLASLIADVTSIFTAAISWVATVGTTITETPLLLMFVIIPVIFLGVNMFRRLLNV